MNRRGFLTGCATLPAVGVAPSKVSKTIGISCAGGRPEDVGKIVEMIEDSTRRAVEMVRVAVRRDMQRRGE